MTQQARAVVSREYGKPVVVETVSVDPPQRGEVMIRLAACGVCHSDLSATNGTIPFPLPVVLGHEFWGTSIPTWHWARRGALLLACATLGGDRTAGAKHATRGRRER